MDNEIDGETQFDETCQNDGDGDRNNNGHLFEIYKHNAREFYPVVKAMNFREYCAMTICNEGIRIIVDDQHHEQGSVYFKYDHFSEFTLRSNASIHLQIPMVMFMEALNIFAGNNTAMRMHYDGFGEPLVIRMEDEGIVFNCEISTQIPSQILDFEFHQGDVRAKCIMAPNIIKEIVREFDSSSPTVLITITQTYISFYTDGDLGKFKAEIPSHSEQVELMECLDEKCSFSYRLSLIRKMAATFSLCNKVSMRINNRGTLSVQFLVPQSDQQSIFVEFYCVSDTDIVYQ